MLEKWNNEMAPFGQIYACGGILEARWSPKAKVDGGYMMN
jgi:hypothetical protein